jgi:hypothetical protein
MKEDRLLQKQTATFHAKLFSKNENGKWMSTS